jgi:hypothetical protein
MASPAPASLKDAVGSLDRDGFVGLLSKLIGETAHLQNDPPTHRPQEERVAQHVVDVLRPVSVDTGGGPLLVRKISYAEGRSNVIVEYPGTVPGRVVSFVGMHMDVVPANASEWVGPPEFSANRGYILFGYRRPISTFIDFVIFGDFAYHQFITRVRVLNFSILLNVIGSTDVKFAQL